MVLRVIVLLSAVFALCSAFPWRYSTLFQGGVEHHETAATAAVTENTCVTVSGPPGMLVGSNALHVCDFRPQLDVCVFPNNLQPCCASLPIFSEERIKSAMSETVTLADTSYLIRFYTENIGSCYIVKTEEEGSIPPLCNRDPRCEPLCVPPPPTDPVCGIGLDSCDDGECLCLEGYAGPDCCSCDTGYYRPIDSQVFQCLPCNCCASTDDSSVGCDGEGRCGECAPGFIGDKCCEACSCCPQGTVDGSSECNGDGTCSCAPGHSGEDCCINVCSCCLEGTSEGTNECDERGVCNCRPGFLGNKCCNSCDCCTTGTLGGSEECDAEGLCECADGYIGDKCCEPCNCCIDGTDDGSFTCDASGNCGLCGVGFFGDKCCGTCPCCEANTLTGTNVCDVNSKCECQAGFSGDDCCENPCACCTEGTVGGSNECDKNGVCNCMDGYQDDKCCTACDCCTTGTLGGSEECDAEGICECADGYIGDKCCEPCNCCKDGTDDGSFTCDASGNCGLCGVGFFGDKCCDMCQCCAKNTVSETNECDAGGVCECLPGFSGDNCCTDDCGCCTANTVGGSNGCGSDTKQCNCAPGFGDPDCCKKLIACGKDTDFYVLMDTTKSYRNHDLCLQTYMLMEIVTALNIGTGDDQSLVATILYPAPGESDEDAPASFLNHLGGLNATDCEMVCGNLEIFQKDTFQSIFEFGYAKQFPSRGDSTVPQNAIDLLADALNKRTVALDKSPLINRRIAGILLTDGEHHGTGLEAARSRLPSQLDLIAAGFHVPNGMADRDLLEKDLTVIAGSPGNIIIEESIPALAESIVRLLIQKGIICPDDGRRMLVHMAANNYGDAQEYCRCLQNEYSGVHKCRSPPAAPQCPAQKLLEEEIMAAVEEVLQRHGNANMPRM